MPGGFESAPTAYTSAAFPCSVVTLPFHRARFHGYSVRSDHENGSTSHGLAAFLYPAASNLLPPRTLRLPFRARWPLCRPTSYTFPAILCAVVQKAVPPRTALPVAEASNLFPPRHSPAAFLCPVASNRFPPRTLSLCFNIAAKPHQDLCSEVWQFVLEMH